MVRLQVRDLDFSVDVIGCPVIREADGLAMSSRNVGLSEAVRQQVVCCLERNIGPVTRCFAGREGKVAPRVWWVLSLLLVLNRMVAGAQALSISKSLRASAEAVTAREWNPETVRRYVEAAIRAAGGEVDYVEVSAVVFRCVAAGDHRSQNASWKSGSKHCRIMGGESLIDDADRGLCGVVHTVLAQVVEQESLRSVRVVEGPVVIAVAAWFGGVRLLDNVEVGSRNI